MSMMKMDSTCVYFKGDVDAKKIMAIIPDDYMGYAIIDGNMYYSEENDIRLSGKFFVTGNVNVKTSKIFIDGDFYCEGNIFSGVINSTGNITIRGDIKKTYAVTALGDIFLSPIMFDAKKHHINQVFINDGGDYIW